MATLHTREIIRTLWDAQGFGNVAVWQDGTTRVIAPGEQAEHGGKTPLVVFKPIALVSGFPMLDHALGDAALLEEIERAVREAGGEITRD
jgi:hypothetical protein